MQLRLLASGENQNITGRNILWHQCQYTVCVHEKVLLSNFYIIKDDECCHVKDLHSDVDPQTFQLNEKC